MMQQLKLSLSLLCLISFTAQAEVKIFKPSFPAYSADQEKNSGHQVVLIGTATINKTSQVPIYGVKVANSLEDGLYSAHDQCKSPKVCDFTIAHFDPKQAPTFKILILPGLRATLVPKNWKVIDAAYGVNGTASAKIMSPQHDEAITLYNSSVCYGCGLPNATLYFPELLKKSVENEFGGYKDSNKYLKITRPNKNVAYFSYQIPNYSNLTHGIATYDDEDSFNYQEIKVSLLTQHQSQARFILNMFQSGSPFF